MQRILLLSVLATSFGCASLRSLDHERVMGGPTESASILGTQVTLEGKASNAKLGALLLAENYHIWIDGMREWPDGYYEGHDKAKKVRVTGTVIEKFDLYVFIEEPGAELRRAGFPVPKGTSLKEASRRFLLKDAQWIVID